MRKCLKCGTEYADTDFRTLCGNCMGNLVEVKSPAVQEAPSTGPVSVDGPAPAASAIPITLSMPEISVPEIVMPEITLPEVAPPEAPLPDAALPAETGAPAPMPEAPTRPPGPYRPPLTPKPEPAVPPPPIVPMPSPNPEQVPAVPAPQPLPRPQPVPQPVPAPSPEEPAPTADAPAAQAAQQRPLTPEELTSNRIFMGINMVAGVLCAIFFFRVLGASMPGFFKLLMLVGTGWLTFFFVRQGLYRGAIQSVKIAPRAPVRLGDTATLEVTVATMRDMAVSEAELTVTGEERATKGSGNATETHRHTFCTRKVRVPVPRIWQGGQEYLLKVPVTIPPDAAPSFAGRQYAIEWSVALWLGINGVPDVRERVPLTVLPVRAKSAAPAPAAPVFQLPQLGPLNAQLGFTCPVGEKNKPVFQMGQEVPFTLRMHPQGDFGPQRVFVELAYVISGAAEREHAVVARQSYPISTWAANPGHVEQGRLQIPAQAPVTYAGTHMHVHWAITVRHELPWGHDNRQVFEVLVVPRAEW